VATHLCLGIILEGEHDIKAAQEHLREAARLDPLLPEAQHLLGVIADNLGQLENAADLYEKAIHLQQRRRDSTVSPELYYNAALVSQVLGNTSQYVHYLNALVTVDSGFADVRNRLADEMIK